MVPLFDYSNDTVIGDSMTIIEATAIDLTKGNIKFFLTSLTTDELMSTCKISRINEKTEQGFQSTSKQNSKIS